MGKRRHKNILWFVALALSIVLTGCGAENSSKGFESEKQPPLDLVGILQNSVWHDGLNIVNINERKEQGAQTLLEPLLLLEDGIYYRDALLTRPAFDGEKSSLYGIYQIDILDADRITFKVSVGFPYEDAPSDQALTFRLMLQEEDDFPVLSETTLSYSGKLTAMDADLTRYRGRNKFLILSVESDNQSFSKLDGIWVEPKIYYEFLN